MMPTQRPGRDQFDDHRPEFENLIREQLAAKPRYTAMVKVGANLDAKHFSDAEAVLSWFEQNNAGGKITEFLVTDWLRDTFQGRIYTAKKYDRAELSAFLNEATIMSAALHLYRKKTREDMIAAAEKRPKP